MGSPLPHPESSTPTSARSLPDQQIIARSSTGRRGRHPHPPRPPRAAASASSSASSWPWPGLTSCPHHHRDEGGTPRGRRPHRRSSNAPPTTTPRKPTTASIATATIGATPMSRNAGSGWPAHTMVNPGRPARPALVSRFVRILAPQMTADSLLSTMVCGQCHLHGREVRPSAPIRGLAKATGRVLPDLPSAARARSAAPPASGMGDQATRSATPKTQ